MNILIVADLNSTHNQKRINYLAKQGHKCFVVSIRYTKEQKKLDWIPIYPKEENVQLLSFINPFSLKNIFKTIHMLLDISLIIKKKDIDILFIQYVEPGAILALLSNYFNIKIILSTQGTDVLKIIPSFFMKKNFIAKINQILYKMAFKKADYIIATSKNQIESIQKFMSPYSIKDKSYIIRTGIDIEKIDSLDLSILPSELIGKEFIFFPRSMRPIYNHEFSLNAIALLSDKLRKKYSFVFIDKDSSSKSYVNNIIQKMEQIDAKFIFLTHLNESNLMSTYFKSKLIIMTPLSDGCPVSGMEALYFEKPLIMGPLNYDEDIFGKPILKLDSWNEYELAKKITEVLTDGKINMQGTKLRIEKFCNINIEFKRLNQLILNDKG